MVEPSLVEYMQGYIINRNKFIYTYRFSLLRWEGERLELMEQIEAEKQSSKEALMPLGLL